ncbi:MAG: RimK family alpha-L-glutamate ligase [Rubripirellula sp.]
MSKPLLLIVGGESDPNTQRIVDQAHLRDVGYFFWNTDLEEASRIAWDFESSRLDLSGDSIEPAAVYLRYNVFEGDPSLNIAAFEMIQSYVLAWPQIKILNRASMTDANNKSKNLRLAKEIGFAIPDTIVMGDLTPLNRIPDPAQRIIKPLNGGAHTVAVEDIHQDLVRLGELGPQFVQSKLPGENLRIFVIGGQPFCFHLQTDMLDYREDANVSVVQIEVPEALVAPSLEMAQQIGFDYCALDFRCREGMQEPVFLEVNSFPMFVRFDDAGQNCLADAVLKFLLS